MQLLQGFYINRYTLDSLKILFLKSWFARRSSSINRFLHERPAFEYQLSTNELGFSCSLAHKTRYCYCINTLDLFTISKESTAMTSLMVKARVITKIHDGKMTWFIIAFSRHKYQLKINVSFSKSMGTLKEEQVLLEKFVLNSLQVRETCSIYQMGFKFTTCEQLLSY